MEDWDDKTLFAFTSHNYTELKQATHIDLSTVQSAFDRATPESHSVSICYPCRLLYIDVQTLGMQSELDTIN